VPRRPDQARAACRAGSGSVSGFMNGSVAEVRRGVFLPCIPLPLYAQAHLHRVPHRAGSGGVGRSGTTGVSATALALQTVTAWCCTQPGRTSCWDSHRPFRWE
jgi:hypothetical protein